MKCAHGLTERSINMEDEIICIENKSYTTKEIENIVENFTAEYRTIFGLPLRLVSYVTMFDARATHITISLIDEKTYAVFGNIMIYISDKTDNYGMVHDLYISPSVRRKHYAKTLMLIAQDVIFCLKLGVFLQVTKNTWMEDWYKRMDYLVDEEHNTDDYIQLYKDLKIE